MRLMRVHQLKTGRDAGDGEVATVFFKAFADAGFAEPMASFYIADNPLLKTSATAQILKVDPSLSGLRLRLDAFPADALGNADPFGEPVVGREPVPLRQIEPFVVGMTTRYKVGWANVVVRDARFGSGDARFDHCVAMRGEPSVAVRVEHTSDASAESPPPIDDRAARFVAALGVTEASWSCEATTEDENTVIAQAWAAGTRWVAECDAVLASLPLPHDLGTRPFIGSGSGLTSPHKAALVSVFHPRGWAYVAAKSGHGTYTMTKRTPLGNSLCLSCDVGALSHNANIAVSVDSAMWRTNFIVPVALGQGRRDYPIDGVEGWQRIVENAAVVVDWLERERVPTAEAIGGAPPAWWQPD